MNTDQTASDTVDAIMEAAERISCVPDMRKTYTEAVIVALVTLLVVILIVAILIYGYRVGKLAEAPLFPMVMIVIGGVLQLLFLVVLFRSVREKTLRRITILPRTQQLVFEYQSLNPPFCLRPKRPTPYFKCSLMDVLAVHERTDRNGSHLAIVTKHGTVRIDDDYSNYNTLHAILKFAAGKTPDDGPWIESNYGQALLFAAVIIPSLFVVWLFYRMACQ